MREQVASRAYTPVAVYYDLADTLEYVRVDSPCVARRVDEHLTLVYDMFDRERLVGFRLKGFMNLYLRVLKPVCDRLGVNFVQLTTVVERAAEQVAAEVFDDDRRQAYRQAFELAEESQAKLCDLPAAA